MIPYTSLKELQIEIQQVNHKKRFALPFFISPSHSALDTAPQPEVHNNYEKIRNAPCPQVQLQYLGWLFGLHNNMNNWALQGTGNIKGTQSLHSPCICQYFLLLSHHPQTSPPRWFWKSTLYIRSAQLWLF